MTSRNGTETARLLSPADHAALAELFGALDAERFHPHGFTSDDALRIASHQGKDVYAVLETDGRFVAYGILRGWDEGFSVPSLGIAVRNDEQGRGHGRRMMEWLAGEALRRGAHRIRLRVHADNTPARKLYESVGYRYDGEERGELVMVVDL